MPSNNKARHSKAEVRWGTPSDIVERARKLMGSIDLDPCSSTDFNEVVKAKTYYSLDDRGEDGLKLPWFGNVILNPPGGAVKGFWNRLFDEPIKQAIFIGFSVEQLALLANEVHHPMDFSFCILRKRVRFIRHDGYDGSPTHSNYVAGIHVDHVAFTREFAPVGRVYAPQYPSG